MHWARLNGRAPLGRPSSSAACAVGDAGGGSVEYAFTRERRNFCCPSPLKRAGPARRVANERGPVLRPSPTSRSNIARQGRRGRAGAGVLPGGTGHLRRRPAYWRAQEVTTHPPSYAMTAGEAGCERTIGRGGRGRRQWWARCYGHREKVKERGGGPR